MSDLDDDQFATNSVTLHVYDLCEILGQKDPIINGKFHRFCKNVDSSTFKIKCTRACVLCDWRAIDDQKI